MSETKTITLGGKAFAVEAVPLGRLKVLVPAITEFSRAAANITGTGQLSEHAMEQGIKALSAGLGLSIQEVELMPARLEELLAAVEALAEVSGLAAREGEPGESQPAAIPATDSTRSTDSSPTS